MAPMGRPRDYRHRRRVLVSFEATELAAITRAARTAGVAVAAWCRHQLVGAATRDAAPVSERRAARGGDTLDAEGDCAPSRARGAGAGRALLHASGGRAT